MFYVLQWNVMKNNSQASLPKKNVYIFTSYSLSKLQLGLNPQMHFRTHKKVICDITKQLGQKTQSSSATKSSGSLYFKLQIQHRKPSLLLITGNSPPTMPSSDFLGYGKATMSFKSNSASVWLGNFLVNFVNITLFFCCTGAFPAPLIEACCTGPVH